MRAVFLSTVSGHVNAARSFAISRRWKAGPSHTIFSFLAFRGLSGQALSGHNEASPQNDTNPAPTEAAALPHPPPTSSAPPLQGKDGLEPMSAPSAVGPAEFCTIRPAKSLRALGALSRNHVKQIRTPPSKTLTSVLHWLELKFALPAFYAHRPDLSYANPRIVRLRRFQERRIKESSTLSSFQITGEDYRLLTLSDILSRYLLYLYPRIHITGPTDSAVDLDTAICEVFTDTAINLLANKGYLPEDVSTWAWIIAEPNVERAALRLFHVKAQGSALKKPLYPVPNFVLLFLLRRRTMNARALRLLLVYTWSRVTSMDDLGEELRGLKVNSPEPSGDTEPKPTMDGNTIVILAVRLLRHARRVWPQALESIAELIVHHIRPQPGSNQTSPGNFPLEEAARLVFVFNRALSLLSEPSSINPYRSVPYYQRAQFKLIKRMAEYEPALPISREGYRAVLRVQLVHRKTQSEQEWAGKQSQSWPPWKENRLGIDADEDLNNDLNKGKSRAMEVITQMREAGYGEGSWEKVAGIYAGRDTDGSPTIQTRTFLRRGRLAHPLSSMLDSQKDQDSELTTDEDGSEIWVARIKATRTAKEAWACFLVHTDQRLRPSLAIYTALLEKLNYEFHRVKRSRFKIADPENPETSAAPTSFPGDGKETFPPPVSPYEGVYTRSEPPELPELFDRMLQDGLHPTKKCVANLICTIQSVRLVRRILTASELMSRHVIKALTSFTRQVGVHDGVHEGHLTQVPEIIYGAYIRHLCGLPRPIYIRTPEQSTRYFGSSWPQTCTVSPLVHAIQLVEARRPATLPPWIGLLAALARPRVHVRETRPMDGRTSRWDDIITWKLMRALLPLMNMADLDLTLQTVGVLCLGFAKAAAASFMVLQGRVKAVEFHVKPHRVLEVGGLDLKLEHPVVEAQNLLRHGPAFIKSAFQFAVGASIETRTRYSQPMWEAVQTGLGDMSRVDQVMLAVPGPWELHAYIRALGVCKDYNGLISILQWMASHVPELSVPVNEAGNGKRQMRLSLIAARVSLERGWHAYWGFMPGSSTRAPDEIIDRAREIVNGMEDWGAWPDDAEVELYTARWGKAGPNDVAEPSSHESADAS